MKQRLFVGILLLYANLSVIVQPDEVCTIDGDCGASDNEGPSKYLPGYDESYQKCKLTFNSHTRTRFNR